MNLEATNIPVKVAIRCRPLSAKETREGCQTCVQFIDNEPQVVLGLNRAFTFDYVYSPRSKQSEIYSESVKPLIVNVFNGYNGTILAYGQTGSGKTFTMGTVFAETVDENKDDEIVGIIPRAIRDLFREIEERQMINCSVKVSFLEIYREDILDLLSPTGQRDEIAIREDSNGGVKIIGLYEIPVMNSEQTLKCLQRGSLSRTTAATAMNAQSSRSHAIFTVSVECASEGGCSTLSKLHFVDLAGSERAKKTKAKGDRFKEGVNINLGLLALGNVISALSKGGSCGFVPYREAKLTRLLQDSLGGNSHTVMVACISPADSNMEETVNTLRYAHRARKIKNKPIVNRDPMAAEVAHLKQMIQELQLQLINKEGDNDVGTVSEIKVLREQNHDLQSENDKLAREIQNAIVQTTGLYEKAFVAEMARDKMKQNLDELRQKAGLTLDSFSQSLDASGMSHLKGHLDMFKGLEEKIVELQGEQQKLDETIANCDKVVVQTPADGDDGIIVTNEKSAEITLRQVKMNRELQEINRLLVLKEELAGRLVMGDDKINVMKHDYETNMRELEAEVVTLQKEREDLNRALQAAKASAANSKLSEQRGKRLQELEAQIVALRKKIVEYSKMSKMKEQSDLQVAKLNGEIQELKQARVRLVRQMKKEAEQLREWKLQKEKEVCQLKQQDRKRQFELVRKEQQFNKQQNVMKIKMEQTVAVNKRLKEALAKQKQNGDQRRQERKKLAMQKMKQSVNPEQVKQRVTEWISEEFDLAVSTREAEYYLDSILNDRKIISEQINNLQQQLNRQESSTDSDRSTDNECEIVEMMDALSNNLELLNIQISDLQHKILDADQEEKGRIRYDTLQTMNEAKLSLRWLFEMAVSAKVDRALTNSQLLEAKNNYDEALKNLGIMQAQLEELKTEHEEQIVALQKAHGDKILFLLNKMPNSAAATSTELDEDLRDRLKFQEEQIKMLGDTRDELNSKIRECECLHQEIAELKFLGPNQFAVPKIKVKRAKPSLQSGVSNLSDTDGEDSKRERKSTGNGQGLLSYAESPVSGCDSDKDPDWTCTPLIKRIRQMKSKKFVQAASLKLTDSDESDDDEPKRKKRSSELKLCTCSKTDCSSRVCSCRKAGTSCSTDCRCLPSCKNKV